MDEQEEGTLADLCIKNIILHFDRFMEARVSKISTIHPKYFEFLQKTESKTLVRNLSHTNTFFKNLNYLLNPYLKDVNLKSCVWKDITPVTKRLTVIADNITYLKLSESFRARNLMELMCHLPNVRTLALSGVHVTEEMLRNIGKHCISLKTLDLAICRSVTDAGIQALCSNGHADKNNPHKTCKNYTLEHLVLLRTSVTTIGIRLVLEHFLNIRLIEHVNVHDTIYKLHVEDLQHDSSLNLKPYKLKELRIWKAPFYPVLDVFQVCSSRCPYITTLYLYNVSSQEQIDACAQLIGLKEVHFSEKLHASINLSSFIESPGKQHLEVFKIAGGIISTESLLKFCPNLESLCLRGTEFEQLRLSQNNIKTLGYTFPCLRNLSLTEISFETNEIPPINILFSSSPNLEKVSFYNTTRLTRDFVNAITSQSCMIHLHELNVSYSDIELASVQRFLSVTPNLNILRIEHCEFSREDYKIMQNLRQSLKIIWTDDNESDIRKLFLG